MFVRVMIFATTQIFLLLLTFLFINQTAIAKYEPSKKAQFVFGTTLYFSLTALDLIVFELGEILPRL